MKLLCKKNHDKITQGKYYTFIFIGFKNWYSTVNDIGLTFYFSNTPLSSLNNVKPQVDFYIWDYFYTPQQIRKIKLEKLNEITLQKKSR